MHPHLQQMNNKTRHISLVCYTMNLAHANFFCTLFQLLESSALS